MTLPFEPLERYLRDHPQNLPRPGKGECPVCLHSGCFGSLFNDNGTWACFSTSHPSELGRSGKVVVWGDLLDLELAKRGVAPTKETRTQFLRDLNYLPAQKLDYRTRLRVERLRKSFKNSKKQAKGALRVAPDASTLQALLRLPQALAHLTVKRWGGNWPASFEELTERSAIMEFESGLSRDEAEKRAVRNFSKGSR